MCKWSVGLTAKYLFSEVEIHTITIDQVPEHNNAANLMIQLNFVGAQIELRPPSIFISCGNSNDGSRPHHFHCGAGWRAPALIDLFLFVRSNVGAASTPLAFAPHFFGAGDALSQRLFSAEGPRCLLSVGRAVAVVPTAPQSVCRLASTTRSSA